LHKSAASFQTRSRPIFWNFRLRADIPADARVEKSPWDPAGKDKEFTFHVWRLRVRCLPLIQPASIPFSP
jgi:hypothetical protein